MCEMTTRSFMTFPNTTNIAYHTKKRQIHLFVCHAILVVFGNAMKLRVYRQNSKNWLSPSRDYHLSDWLNGIDLHQKFPVQVISI
jgi:hypothetical protein